MPTAHKEHWPDAPFMVIDNDQSWAAALTEALQRMGWKDIRHLTDPQHASAIAREFRPAIIMLDLRIGGKNGLDLLEDLRLNLSQVPVIIATNIKDVELAVSCMQRGACHYLVKPLCQDQLIAALNIALTDRECRHNSPHDGAEITDLSELPSLNEVKDLLIEEALRRSDGTLRDAADMLGVTPQAICNRRRRAAEAEDQNEDENNSQNIASDTTS